MNTHFAREKKIASYEGTGCVGQHRSNGGTNHAQFWKTCPSENEKWIEEKVENNGKGTYDDIMRGLKLLSKASIGVMARMNVDLNNKGEENWIEFINELNGK